MQYGFNTVFLKALQHFSLSVNSVSMGEGEVVHTFIDFGILSSLLGHLFFVHEHGISFHKGVLLKQSVPLFVLQLLEQPLFSLLSFVLLSF